MIGFPTENEPQSLVLPCVSAGTRRFPPCEPCPRYGVRTCIVRRSKRIGSVSGPLLPNSSDAQFSSLPGTHRVLFDAWAVGGGGIVPSAGHIAEGTPALFCGSHKVGQKPGPWQDRGWVSYLVSSSAVILTHGPSVSLRPQTCVADQAACPVLAVRHPVCKPRSPGGSGRPEASGTHGAKKPEEGDCRSLPDKKSPCTDLHSDDPGTCCS